jgi:hypothetical protein
MPSKIDAVLESLGQAVHDVEKLNRSIGQLRAIYTELYVAKKLEKCEPQLGYDREVRTADIYLARSGKLVEIKADEKGVFSGEADFAWSISPKQLDGKFDYCVMIGYSESLKIEKVFVFTAKDFKKEPKHNPEFIRDLAGVCYGQTYRGHTPLEKRLHLHPEEFENRWDKIQC